MSALLNLQKACKGAKYISFNDLQIGSYQIERFSIVKTEYGMRVKVTMVENYVFLPERFIELITKKDIEELNQGKYVMVFGGKEAAGKGEV